ncbi:MAG: NAD(P)-dependent oxidoreductase [Candidatus Cloacimonetes bacterium]|nr:NAD(P)-dependent oxidoreductase [Candidatus Cloacimonadota bacterium]
MKKIAITGSNGFIGSTLTRILKKNYDVISLVRYGSNIELLPEDSTIVYIDYHKPDKIAEILKDVEILIHTAALTRAKTWQQFKKINIDLTEKLVDIFNDTESLKQFVFISSQAASGPAQSKTTPKIESDKCEPISMYGRSKFLAENIIKEKANKPWTIIRPVAVFGPGDKDFLQYFKLMKSHLAFITGFKKKYINLIYVDDLVEITSKTLVNEKAYNQILFASNSEAYSLENFIQNLGSFMNTYFITIHVPEILLYPIALIGEFFSIFSKKPPIINREKIKEFKERYWLVNNEKANKLLDFKPSDNIVQNLQTTYNWYKEKKWI